VVSSRACDPLFLKEQASSGLNVLDMYSIYRIKTCFEIVSSCEVMGVEKIPQDMNKSFRFFGYASGRCLRDNAMI